MDLLRQTLRLTPESDSTANTVIGRAVSGSTRIITRRTVDECLPENNRKALRPIRDLADGGVVDRGTWGGGGWGGGRLLRFVPGTNSN